MDWLRAEPVHSTGNGLAQQHQSLSVVPMRRRDFIAVPSSAAYWPISDIGCAPRDGFDAGFGPINVLV
jgi:hypothetical protein